MHFKRDSVSNLVLTEDIVDADKGVFLARAFEPLTKTIVRSFQKAGRKKVVAIDTTVDDGAIIRCLKKDPTQNEEEALKDIYKRLRPGEPPTTANAKGFSNVSSKIHVVTTSVEWSLQAKSKACDGHRS